MILTKAEIGPFKSINQPQTVHIGPHVTALVGMNEAGKTVFLQALEKTNDALGLAEFRPVDDYPRKDLNAYLKRHKVKAESAVELTFQLEDNEVETIVSKFGVNMPMGFEFSVTYLYDNGKTISLPIDEGPAVERVIKEATLSTDAKAALKDTRRLRDIPDKLQPVGLTDTDETFLAEINARIKKQTWDRVIQQEIWRDLSLTLPRFLYFGDYDLLPSKVNLADLATRVQAAATDASKLTPKHRAALALLRMADISLDEFSGASGYEELKARIEGVSISLTDQIMEFWKQNEDLEVEIDIKADPQDDAPFDNGVNLYLRIKNKRHRGVSTPFEQRSRGFIWFFSFLVWFDSVDQQLDKAKKSPLILLLDEPGMALHALAQKDFLRYIDTLGENHQVLYTTHSPFMVNSDRLSDVRVVEDKDSVGTVISSDLSTSNARTTFPLQAALGWTLAQNLFISSRNLLVEGPSELVYFKCLSSRLEALGRTCLRDDVTIVPTGGLDKVVTFIALLGANGLELTVFHDYKGTPEQKLVELVREKLLTEKSVFNASQFRDLSKIGQAFLASDVEDLFAPATYLDYFNLTYARQLAKKPLKEKDLEKGDRIVDRINRTLETKGISLRASGGFNHYLVASQMVSDPELKLDDDTLHRFEEIFKAINLRYQS